MAFGAPDFPPKDILTQRVLLRNGKKAFFGEVDAVAAALKEMQHRLGKQASGVNLPHQKALQLLYGLAHAPEDTQAIARYRETARNEIPVMQELGLLDEQAEAYPGQLPVLRAAIEKQGARYIVHMPLKRLSGQGEHDAQGWRAEASYAGLADEKTDWSRYIKSAAARGAKGIAYDKDQQIERGR